MAEQDADQAAGQPPSQQAPQPSRTDEQNMAMLCHLIAFSGVAFPLGHVLGPLILWLIKKDSMPLVDLHGKESLNFQITVSIAAAICFATSFLVVPLLALVVILISAIILTIIASVKASNGEFYRYPLTIRLLK
jgi:uncharacterized protein